MKLDPKMFDMERLLKTLIDEPACLRWRHECEILPAYVATYAQPGARPEVRVRHVPSGTFLRYSAGPLQGHFWDCYGEDYQTPELALRALLEAPPPFWYFRELQPAPRQERPGHDEGVMDGSNDDGADSGGQGDEGTEPQARPNLGRLRPARKRTTTP